MFRQSLLPRACLTLALGLTLSYPPAWGQERSPYERLDRLERDLNMLQRHVYRGAAVSTYAPDGAASVNAQLRMDRLEAEMRELTGRVEEYGNRLEQLRRRVEQLNGEADLRFGPRLRSGGSRPGCRRDAAGALRHCRRAAASRSPAGNAGAAGSYDDERGPPPNGPPLSGPTPIVGTLTPPGVSPEPPLAAAARPTR